MSSDGPTAAYSATGSPADPGGAAVAAVADAAIPRPRTAPDGWPTPADVSAVLAGARNGDPDTGLHLVAQPILAVEFANVAGYELLARFTSRVKAPPDQWFAVAREAGMANRLTAAVFEQMHLLRPSLPPNTFCTVNIEPDLLMDDVVDRALHATGSLERVIVELTEHVAIEDPAPLLLRLDRIRAAGGTVAIDDAGTGYAGLAQLLSVRPDLIKLDRELVTGIDTDPVRRALVELIGSLAGRMDAWLLAEGVETSGELSVLARLGVPLAQGWFIGRPAEAWPAIDPELRNTLRAITLQARLGDHVAQLVRRRPPRQAGDGALSPGDVVVDELERPLRVAVAESHGVSTVPAMCVAPSSSPADVLRRAVARPPGQRDAPVVCTDPRGRLIGTVDIADLVDAALADHGEKAWDAG